MNLTSYLMYIHFNLTNKLEHILNFIGSLRKLMLLLGSPAMKNVEKYFPFWMFMPKKLYNYIIYIIILYI